MKPGQIVYACVILPRDSNLELMPTSKTYHVKVFKNNRFYHRGDRVHPTVM